VTKPHPINVKAYKIASMKCGRLKKGDEGKQTFDTKIYPVVSVGTKSPLVHVVEALTESIASRSPNLLRDSS
jgi:hypothetical protein